METESLPEVIKTINPVPMRAVTTTPATILEMAVAKGADIGQLQQLMEMQIEWEKNEARKAYFCAVAEFKKNPPKIYKDANVNYDSSKGNTNYNHATLGNVTEKISAGLAPHGLSIGFKQSQASGVLTVTCTLTHCQGYSESTSLSAAPDTSGGKNSIQAIGSSNAYLQRYTGLAITGLATHEMDDDGRKSENVEMIDEKQLNTLTDMLLAIEKTEKDYCGFKKVAELKDIPKSWFNACLAELKPVEK